MVPLEIHTAHRDQFDFMWASDTGDPAVPTEEIQSVAGKRGMAGTDDLFDSDESGCARSSRPVCLRPIGMNCNMNSLVSLFGCPPPVPALLGRNTGYSEEKPCFHRKTGRRGGGDLGTPSHITSAGRRYRKTGCRVRSVSGRWNQYLAPVRTAPVVDGPGVRRDAAHLPWYSRANLRYGRTSSTGTASSTIPVVVS